MPAELVSIDYEVLPALVRAENAILDALAPLGVTDCQCPPPPNASGA
jgi:hypothetical protein